MSVRTAATPLPVSTPNPSRDRVEDEVSLVCPQEHHAHFHALVQPALVGYRSVGIGLFGATMRYLGMPLEKIALYMNSSQVSTNSGISPLRQALRLTFADGYLAPYRVVGPASITAWFLQYSVMGVAFQFFDQALSAALQVRPMYYGRELMEPPEEVAAEHASRPLREAVKLLAAPALAATLESLVSNRAEVQRYFGGAGQVPHRATASALRRLVGPALAANVGRNLIMCHTSFVLTPYTYKYYFPQEHKSKSTLFYYGLTLNIFCGNVLAITQQALWGRTLDYYQHHGGTIDYRRVLQQGWAAEGAAAFFTPAKWASRVLMNAPAQGTLPWFYNEILPLGEVAFLDLLYRYAYRPWVATSGPPTIFAEDHPGAAPHRECTLQRTRTHYGTLPTANPEFQDYPPPPSRR
jgi:hypothetical protein